MNNDEFNEMLEVIKEEAERKSKDEFLRFVVNNYNVDESLFDHIFNIPIIGKYDIDELLTGSVSEDVEDELYEIIDRKINRNKNGENLWSKDDIAKYETFDEIDDDELALSEDSELYSLIKGDDKDLDIFPKSTWCELIKSNAAIIYNHDFLRDALNDDSNNLSKDKLLKKYIIILKDILTHERVHCNNAYLINEPNSESLNGAEENIRYDIEDSAIHTSYSYYWKNNNEVMVETISRMISNYEKGKTLNECLNNLIKERNNKTIYPGIDDRMVLSTYILFTDELTKWMFFGAYEQKRRNILQEKFIEVFGTNMPQSFEKLSIKLQKYVLNSEEGKFSGVQLEMLKMLGLSVDRKQTESKKKYDDKEDFEL